MKSRLSLLILFLSLLSPAWADDVKGGTPGYKDPSWSVEKRVNDLLGRMTLEEKIEMLGGTGFATKAIDRLGIPPLNMTDGPLGVRWGQATAFPSGIMMGATWNPGLISGLGSALGEETKARGRHVILGPCVNIARIPMGGRNFESFGEDPCLASRMAVEYIKGVQKENVAATVKHFAANNQEYQRDHVNTIVDERALNEIYFPAFKAAVQEGQVLTVMSAYNKVNDHFCSENDYLLVDILKKEWGFSGLVMSDWGAVHSTEPTFNSGLDLEMPTGQYLNKETLLKKIKSGALKESTLDDHVRRILGVMFEIGLFDDYRYDASKINTAEHRRVAREVAEEGIVLLKNRNSVLPLDMSKIKTLAVIGPNARVAVTGGGGSSQVTPLKSVSPLEALQSKLGDRVKIHFARALVLDGDSNPIDGKFLFTDKEGREHGLKAEYFTNKNLEGTPAKTIVDKSVDFNWDEAAPFEDFPKDNFSVRWTGYLKVDKPGRYSIDVTTDDGSRLYFEDKLVINDWIDHGIMTNSYTASLEANKYYKITFEFYEFGGGAVARLGWRPLSNELFMEATAAAKNSDAALVFVGTNYTYEGEGFDRKSLVLPMEQDKLIEAIAKVNKHTVVVLTTGSPVLMNGWIDKVDGVVEAWFAGEQIGTAIAEVLLGEINPSGKLPMTFPVRWEDCSACDTYMKEDGTTRYKDGIYVGYRHFEKNRITPLFPFGFGLSYTTFQYSGLNLSSREIRAGGTITVSFKVKNTGKSKGQEVAQLYIADLDSTIDRPVKELKNFQKISLNPGEEKSVSWDIDEQSLKYFDPTAREWTDEKGDFELLVGSSSEDIRLKEKFTLR